jgi:hypothetical protein
MRPAQSLLGLFLIIASSGCAVLSGDSSYKGPAPRPPQLETYYSKGNSYSGFSSREIQRNKQYVVNEITIKTASGDIVIDYYDAPKKDADLVLVFPLLGGKPIVSQHFAEYFAEHNIDSAIVRRNDDFKNPANFGKIEEMLRLNVVRDRIALDFFEKEMGKENFGGFGVSRGAINLSMTAGVDPRIKYNVIAMGASDLPLIFRDSNQGRIQKYIETVMSERKLSKPQVFTFLQEQVKTDPKYVAKHIDARNTMMFLSVFDRTVPYKYGRRLRHEIGNPRTVFLTADHYTIVLYTQLFSILPPGRSGGLFPFGYLELESLDFFREKFKRKETTWKLWPFKILRAPFDAIGYGLEKLF